MLNAHSHSNSASRLSLLFAGCRATAICVAFSGPFFAPPALAAQDEAFDGDTTASPPDVTSDTPPDSDDADASRAAKARDFGFFVNPVGLVFGVLQGEVDYRVTPGVALTGGLSYLDWGIVTGFGAHAGPQIFLTDDAFKGVYVLPRVGFSRATAEFEGVKAQASLVNVGATVGYQWQFSDGFSARLGAGFAYYTAVAAADGIGASLYEGLRPVADGALGYTF